MQDQYELKELYQGRCLSTTWTIQAPSWANDRFIPSPRLIALGSLLHKIILYLIGLLEACDGRSKLEVYMVKRILLRNTQFHGYVNQELINKS